MELSLFNVEYKKKKKILHRYFLKLIRDKTSFSGDLRPLIRDLMDLTYTEAYMKILEGGLSQLPVRVIIMIKARDVFCQMFRIPRKKPKFVEMTPEVYKKICSAPDPYQQLVLKEDMQALDVLLDDASRSLFEKIADGVPGRMIRADLDISLTALTSRIYRLRAQIRGQLKKGY